MTAYDDAVLGDGPLLYLPLNDASGTTAVARAGASGTYTGSPTLGVTGPTPLAGATGISTDGSDDVVVPAAVTLGSGQAQSIEFWANNSADLTSASSFKSLVDQSSTATTGIGFGNGGAGLSEVVEVWNYGQGTSDVTVWTGFTVTAGWHHHLFTYSGTQHGWVYYLDGVATGTKSGNSGGAFGFGAAPVFRLGTWNNTTFQAWAGIAGFAVYNYALSPHQVAAHYSASPLSTYDRIVIRDNPKVYLPLDDPSGTVATDRSAAHSHGTYTGSPILNESGPTPVGSTSVDFDGGDKYVQGAADITISTDMSIEAWAKKDAGTGLYRVVNIAASGAEGHGGIDTYGVGGNNKWRAFMTGNTGGTNYLEAADTATITDDVWYHLAAVYTNSNTTLRLYVNGVQVASDNTTSGTRDTGSSKRLWVSRYSSSFAENFPGWIAGAAFYDYALTANQVYSHYVAAQREVARGLRAGAILYLPLSDVGGTTAYAEVGQNGTYSGGPTLRVAGPSESLAYGVDFDGSDDYAILGTSSTLYQAGTSIPLSVEAWVYPQSGGGSFANIAGRGVSSGNYNWQLQALTTPEFAFVLSTSAGADARKASGGSWSADTWYHVVGTWDGTNIAFYVNGARTDLNSTSLGTIQEPVATSTWAATRPDSAAGSKYSGRVAGLAIYNRALTADEVRSLWVDSYLWPGSDSPLVMG